MSNLTETIASPVTFPNGARASNRLTKTALSEGLSSFGGGPPNASYENIYRAWTRGNWGIIITGNVLVDPKQLGTIRDAVADPKYLPQFTRCADAVHSESPDTLLIMQLNHPGRQSARGFGRWPWQPSLAPSPVTLYSTGPFLDRLFGAALFGQPREMTTEDIDTIVSQFVSAADIAYKAGYNGVQLHASHGYLLAQFLAKNTNLRTDIYGQNKLYIVQRIIKLIRETVPDSFILGIKLNSSDYVKGGLTEEDALENVRELATMGGVDFIEISGGTYENVAFVVESGDKRDPQSSTSKREAFFLHFADQAKQSIAHLDKPPLIMVTGGFRSREGCDEAIRSNKADLIGMGRPACIDPNFPLKLLDPALSPAEAAIDDPVPYLVGLLSYVPISMFKPTANVGYHTYLLQSHAK